MKKWGKPEDAVAQIVEKGQIPGLLHKEILLEGGESALVRKNASIMEELGPGKHTLKGDFTDLVLVDTTAKTLRKTVDSLLTSDDNNVGCELEIKLAVYLPEKLARSLLVARNVLSLDNLYSEFYNELVSKVLSPIVRQTSITDLYGNKDVVDQAAIAFETELRKTLEMWGIELVSLSIIWKFPENYKQYLKQSSATGLASKEKDVEHKEKVKQALREKELDKIKGKGQPTKEEVKSKIEKEAIESDVNLNIRKKESAEDSEEALDALKLKEIMDNQKIAKKARKKKLLEELEEGKGD